MTEPSRKKPLLTLSDLETVKVEKSRITTTTPAMPAAEPPSEDVEAREREASDSDVRAEAEAEARAREEALARRLAETEAARAQEMARARRTQHLLLALGGALAAGLLVALLFLIFRPNPLDVTEYRARNVVPPDLPQPELNVGFVPRPEARSEEEIQEAPARRAPRRSQPGRSAPSVDTGSLF